VEEDGDISIWVDGMREKRTKTTTEGGMTSPHIQLEGRAGAIADGDLGDGAKGPEAGDNVHPNGGLTCPCLSKLIRNFYN
jgi:hypothetical protein